MTGRKLITVLAGLFLLAGCADFEADTLFARRLPDAPTEADWRDAVPLRLVASGGAVHREVKSVAAQEVDQDTVHRNSASCHHGPGGGVTVPVWARAYHDGRNLYLRLTWTDLTDDLESRHWVREQGGWKVEGNEGDGVSLVFPMDGGAFSCAMTCHLDDFRMAGDHFEESARMRFNRPATADLWMWRNSEAAVVDLYMDDRGIKPDEGGEQIRRPNSRMAAFPDEFPGDDPILGRADSPYVGADDKPLPENWSPPPGTELPAYLPLQDELARGNMRTAARYRRGLWEVTLTRPLDTGSPKDIQFRPGSPRLFGVSVMDNTRRDHHVVETARTLLVIS